MRRSSQEQLERVAMAGMVVTAAAVVVAAVEIQLAFSPTSTVRHMQRTIWWSRRQAAQDSVARVAYHLGIAVAMGREEMSPVLC